MTKSLAMASALALVALGLGTSDVPETGGALLRAATAQAPNGSVVAGAVTFLETVPDPERLRVDRDNTTCGLRKLSQDFIVSPNTQGLKNVVLTVVGVPRTAGAPLNDSPALFQQECVYGPHVQTAVLGQDLQITNHDDLLHNIHAYADNQDTLFNVAQPIKGMTFSMELERDGVVRVECDVHSWMQAYIVVAPHPFTAVTDQDGQFRIEGVPPGSYQLRAWHEALGELEKDLTVVVGEDPTVNFEVGK